MTESTIAPAALTPLAAYLNSAGKAPQLAEYRCALTPQVLDAPTAETEALAHGAAIHDLGWIKRLSVRGDDRFRWLSGMVTNTVKDLPTNGGAWNLVLNAQGRIQGDLTVWREGEQLELAIDANQYDRLVAHLEHFIIMDDVELVPVGQEPGSVETGIGLRGPQAADVLTRSGLPMLSEPMTSVRAEWNGHNLRVIRSHGVLADHYEIWIPAAGIHRLWRTLITAGATPAGSNAIEAFRIAEGVPAYGIDMMERDLPQETSQMRALHFNKGCYLGQEIVERIRSRGNVHRHLRSLEIFGPLPKPGTEMLVKGTPAGQITSAACLPLSSGERIFAIGMIRAEAEAATEPLHYSIDGAAGTARILTNIPSL